EMMDKEAAQMPRADADALSKIFDAIFEAALTDEAQGARHGAGGAEPCRGSGGTFGAAAETGAESSFCRGGCGGEVAAIFFLGGRGRADGSAIHSAAANADEEFAIEARVAGETGSRA